MKVCPFCGEMIDDKAKACPACGSDEHTGWSQPYMPDEYWDEDEELSNDKEKTGFLFKDHPVWVVLFIFVVILLIIVFLRRILF